MSHLSFDLVLADMKSATRKQVFHFIAAEMSRLIGIGERVLADKLLDKDRQANCSIGYGVAVADLRLSSLTQPFSVLVRLNHQVDFEAPDSMPVDMIALLVSPERDGPQHLARLSKLSRQMKDTAFCDNLRAYKKADDIRHFLKQHARERAVLQKAA
jgi:PTS system nitrogen regulatory IIA component